MYKGFHIRYDEVTQDEFNEHLNLCQGYYTIMDKYELYMGEGPKPPAWTRWIKDNRDNIFLTYKIGGKWHNVYTNKCKDYTTDPKKNTYDPIQAYAIFARVVQPIDYPDVVSKYNEQNYVPNLGQYRDEHQDKKGIYDYAICYDVNKSFFNACQNPMPTEMVGEFIAPKENEVGFTMNGFPVIGPSELPCRWVLKLERMPKLDRYVEIMKRHLREDKDKYKNYINMAIGNLANHNPFMRNMIVWYSNNYIKQFVDEHTIWSNTDSIVSTVKRDDLAVGTEVGQFKIEHEGRFIQNVTGYQWVDESKISQCGLSQFRLRRFKEVYGRDFILGKDSTFFLETLELWRFNYVDKRLEQIGGLEASPIVPEATL